LITDEKSIDEDTHLHDLNVRLPICGEAQTLKTGEKIRCYDTDDKVEKECIGVNIWYYKCFDGKEWEHRNNFEYDLTKDNSRLTSIETDGFAWTSISIDVR
jgi:hypothetical protein